MKLCAVPTSGKTLPRTTPIGWSVRSFGENQLKHCLTELADGVLLKMHNSPRTVRLLGCTGCTARGTARRNASWRTHPTDDVERLLAILPILYSHNIRDEGSQVVLCSLELQAGNFLVVPTIRPGSESVAAHTKKLPHFLSSHFHNASPLDYCTLGEQRRGAGAKKPFAFGAFRGERILLDTKLAQKPSSS